MTDQAPGHDDHSEYHPPHGIAKYVTVFVSLCILTLMSFAIGSTPWIMRTPSVGWTGMLTVSCAKALLVILFFMHLKWEANWKYVLTIPASMMSLFLLLMLVPDVGMRTTRYSDARWLHAADPSGADQTEEHASHDGHLDHEDAEGGGSHSP